MATLQFDYTGAVQSWLCPGRPGAPQTVTASVQAGAGGMGMAGAGNPVTPGGLGACVDATVPMLAGETLDLWVAAMGQNGETSFFAWGYSITQGHTPTIDSGGFGGAASAITKGGVLLVEAGGGGGGGAFGGTTNVGGNGGTPDGAAGQLPGAGGGGGTQTAGGAGMAPGMPGMSGSAANSISGGASFAGGTGGAGYWGGGGGGNNHGGGGGSSWVGNGATATAWRLAALHEHGHIWLTFTDVPPGGFFQFFP
jgi:hypothetical protein